MKIEVILPWPPAALSPNARSRSHWPRTRALAKTKEWAIYAAYGTKCPPADIIPLTIECHPPVRRGHDKDNLLSRCKGYLDGIAHVWGVNDKAFDPRIVIGEPVKGGKVVVTLDAAA